MIKCNRCNLQYIGETKRHLKDRFNEHRRTIDNPNTKSKPVRVKGEKSLRNGMWNGVRNGIIMRNTIYAGNKLIEERILFSRQFYKSSSFFDVADY